MTETFFRSIGRLMALLELLAEGWPNRAKWNVDRAARQLLGFIPSLVLLILVGILIIPIYAVAWSFSKTPNWKED